MYLHFTKIVKHPLLANEDRALTLKAKSLYFSIYGIYYSATGQSHKEYQVRYRHYRFISTNMNFYGRGSNVHVAILNNLVHAGLEAGKFRKAASFIEELSALPAKTPLRKIRHFTRLADLKLLYYNRLGHFSEGLPVAKSIEEQLQKYQHKIDRNFLSSIYFNLAYLYVGVQQFDKAQGFLEEIIQNKALNVKKDIYYSARFLYLIVQYEQDNLSIFVYLIRSVNRDLRKRKVLYAAERDFIRCMHNAYKIRSKKEVLILFRSLLKRLKKHAQNPYDRHFLVHFDWISWLQAQVEERSFNEVVSEKKREPLQQP